MRKNELEHTEGYVPLIAGLDDNQNPDFIHNKPKHHEKPWSGKMKRTNEKDLLTLFKSALAKNMKLKSNIKSSRF